jgi:hypothetical protein
MPSILDTPKPQPRFSLPHASVPGGVVTNLNTVINQLLTDAAARRRQLDDARIEAFIQAVSEVYR